MSSSRKILGVLVTTGLLSMGTTALLANGAGGNDRTNLAVDYTSTQYSSGSSDDKSPVQSDSAPTLWQNRENDRH
jgi:hypothetical protein